jgi:methionyl-tRNA formyltransferase
VRCVFAGTPGVAIPSLEALVESSHEVVAVVTRPDAPRGRGRAVERSAVAVLADERGIPVLSPASPRDPEFAKRLRELEPDCCPVVAYGALLPAEVLSIPRLGWVNLHFSLLPAWRGAAPVQMAILHGDDITGATTFVIGPGLDDGPVLGTVTESIRATDTSGDLLNRLASSGAGLLVATLDALAGGAIEAKPQPAAGVSLAPKVSVDDARIRWTDPLIGVDRRIRAMTPEPGAWTMLGGERMIIGPVSLFAAGDAEGLAPGEIVVVKSGVWVGTATGAACLGQVRPAGRKTMNAADWARGLRGEIGRFA